MSARESKIDIQLDEYVKKFLAKDNSELEKLNVSEQEVYIDGKKYLLSYHLESFSHHKIFYIELRRKVFWIEKVHPIGIDLNFSAKKILYENDLWSLGLG